MEKKWLHFGEWENDKHIRLFNCKQTHCNEAIVHGFPIFSGKAKTLSVNGYVLHKTAPPINEYEIKMTNYDALNAEKYFKQVKKTGGSAGFLISAGFIY